MSKDTRRKMKAEPTTHQTELGTTIIKATINKIRDLIMKIILIITISQEINIMREKMREHIESSNKNSKK